MLNRLAETYSANYTLCFFIKYKIEVSHVCDVRLTAVRQVSHMCETDVSHVWDFQTLTTNLTFNNQLIGIINCSRYDKPCTYQKKWSTLVCVQSEPSAICRPLFRLVLSRGLLKITAPQHALEPIFRPLFAGVVYGASLTCCEIVRYDVIRRWQRILMINFLQRYYTA